MKEPGDGVIGMKESSDVICFRLKKDGVYYTTIVNIPFIGNKTYENTLTYEEFNKRIRGAVISDISAIPTKNTPEFVDYIFLCVEPRVPHVSSEKIPSKSPLCRKIEERMTFLGEVESPLKGYVYDVYESKEAFRIQKKGKEDMYGISKEKNFEIQRWLLQQELPEKFVVLNKRLKEERGNGWSGLWRYMIVAMRRGEIFVTNDGKYTYIHDPNDSTFDPTGWKEQPR